MGRTQRRRQIGQRLRSLWTDFSGIGLHAPHGFGVSF